MAQEIAAAYVRIYPKTDGFGSAINTALGNAGSQGANAFNSRFSSGLSAGAVAIGNTVANIISSAVSTVASSMDAAISRVDTLNQFPMIMENMGISSDAASASISTLSKGIEGLPTTLDSAASGVQNFVSKNGDIDKSTKYFLALNDAIVAGGQSTAVQQSAMEQLSQAYSKGSMDMIEWRSLLTAMPAQMNQVAQAMGLSTDALGEGLRNGTISMDDFMDAIVRLDTDGVSGFASFADQAQAATGGIATSMVNAKTAIVRNLANIVNAINGDEGRITGFFNNVKYAIDAVGAFVTSNLAPIIAALSSIGAAFVSFKVAVSIGPALQAAQTALSGFFGVLSANPFVAVAMAVAALVAGFIALYNSSEDFRNAVQPGIDAVSAAFQNFVGTVSPLIEQFVATVMPALKDGFTAILPIIEAGWNNLMTVISTVLTVISGLVTFATALMQGDWEGAMSAILGIGEAVWNMLGTIFQSAADILGSIVSGLVSAVVGFFQNLWSNLTSTVASIWSNVTSAFSDGVNSAIEFVSSLPDRILSLFSDAGSWLINSGQSIIQGLVDGIMGAIDWAADSVSSALGSIRNLFPFSPAKSGPFSGRGWTLYSGQSIMESVGEGIESRVRSTVSEAERAMSSVRGAIEADFDGASYEDSRSAHTYNFSAGSIVVQAKDVAEAKKASDVMSVLLKAKSLGQSMAQ